MSEQKLREELKKSYWRDAALNGCAIGGAIVVFMVICWAIQLDTKAPWASGMFNFCVLAISILIYGRQRAQKYGDLGFTFSQSIAYSVSMMLFAGFIIGVGKYVMIAHVAPEYYAPMMEQSVEQVRAAFANNPAAIQGVDLGMRLAKLPPVMILSNIIDSVFMGLILGIISAMYIKRMPGQQR